jgi:hypothetical protein
MLSCMFWEGSRGKKCMRKVSCMFWEGILVEKCMRDALMYVLGGKSFEKEHEKGSHAYFGLEIVWKSA